MKYTIDIHGAIEDELIKCVVDELREVYDFDYKMIETYVNPPELIEEVELDIDSCGGLLNGFMAIRKEVDKLKKLGIKVNTYCSGMALSCGFLLMLLGEKRSGDPLATYMFHQGSIGTNPDRISSNARFMEHQKKIQSKMNEYIASQTNLTVEDLEEYAEIDVYMTADEALELGVLTEEPKETAYVISEEECVKYFEAMGYQVVNEDEYNALKEALNPKEETIEELEEDEEKPKAKKKTKKSK